MNAVEGDGTLCWGDEKVEIQFSGMNVTRSIVLEQTEFVCTYMVLLWWFDDTLLPSVCSEKCYVCCVQLCCAANSRARAGCLGAPFLCSRCMCVEHDKQAASSWRVNVKTKQKRRSSTHPCIAPSCWVNVLSLNTVGC